MERIIAPVGHTWDSFFIDAYKLRWIAAAAARYRARDDVWFDVGAAEAAIPARRDSPPE